MMSNLASTLRLAGLLLTALGIAACGEAPEAHPAPPAITGTLVAVVDSALPVSLMASGVAEPVQRAMLSTRLMAHVEAVLVREGDRVTEGQVLLRLDARELSAKATQAAAGLAAAEAAHAEALLHARRLRALHADSAAPTAQLDQAEAMLQRAEAAVTQARAAGAELQAVASYATVRAPFSGVVVQRLVDPGALAAPGAPLLLVEDHRRLRITVSAAPEHVRALRPGQRVLGDVAGREVEATIEGIVPAPQGHVVVVNALVSGEGLTAGAAAALRLPQGSARRAALVPVSALVRHGDLTGVYVRTPTGTDLRWIRLGAQYGQLQEVLSGLVAGDTVVVSSRGAE